MLSTSNNVSGFLNHSDAAIDDEEEGIGENEKEFLDNISWDTESDENEYYNDLDVCKQCNVQNEKKKTETYKKFDIDHEQVGQEKPRLYEDYYDFNFHDMKKSYVELTPEFQKRLDFKKNEKDKMIPGAKLDNELIGDD